MGHKKGNRQVLYKQTNKELKEGMELRQARGSERESERESESEINW